MEMQTAPNAYRTPANAPNHRQEMRPLPLRVAHGQYERLDAARARTGLSIQEHARRAMDLYLAVIEREAIELGLMPERQPNRPGAGESATPPVKPAPAPVPTAPQRTNRTQPKVTRR